MTGYLTKGVYEVYVQTMSFMLRHCYLPSSRNLRKTSSESTPMSRACATPDEVQIYFQFKIVKDRMFLISSAKLRCYCEPNVRNNVFFNRYSNMHQAHHRKHRLLHHHYTPLHLGHTFLQTHHNESHSHHVHNMYRHQ